jgi:hypothetical protein
VPATRDVGHSAPRKRRRRASAPRGPTRTQLRSANAQARQYRSQGVAVRRAARQQQRAARPRKSGPRGFEPFRRDHGLQRQQRIQTNRTRRAEARLPDNRYVPHIPLKSGGYTPRERAAVRTILRSAAKRGGYRSVEELYRSASPRQRQQIRRVGRVVTFGPQVAKDPLGLIGVRERNRSNVVRAGAPRAPLARTALKGAALFGTSQGHTKLLKAAGLTGINVTRAFYESPGQTSATSLRTARESITGIPQGIAALAEDPVKAVESIVKDYEDRYGSVLDDPKKFRERVKKDWGLTPYVFDAAAAAGGTGQILGRVATTTRFGRAAAALERSRVPGARAARAAHETMASERPGLRFSGGETGVRPQPRSRNLFVGLGQRRLDVSREKAHGKRLGQDKRRMLDLEVRPGEVTAKTNGVIGRSLREFSRTNRRYTGRVARDIGSGISQTRMRILSARVEALGHKARPILRGLSKHEKVAVREMAELGVRPGPAGIRALQTRLAKLEADGFGENVDAVAIREILSDPERHLTAKAAKAVDELRDLQIERAALDPELPAATELMSRLASQAEHLGVKRGPNVERFLRDIHKIEEKTGVMGLADLARDVVRATPEDRPALAKELAKRVRTELKRAERDVPTADRRAAVARAQVEATGRITTPEVRAARQELAEARLTRARLSGELKGRRGEGYTVRGVRDGRTFRIEATREALADAKQRVSDARQRVREAEAVAPVGSDVQRARVVHHEIQAAARRETRDHVAKVDQAVRKIHKKVKSQSRKQANPATFDPRLVEGHHEFAARVRAAADESGLAEPAYWKGMWEGDMAPAPRLAAAGKGVRATERPKRKQGTLTRQGRGERDPEVLVRGIETNIKRQFQTELVLKNVEAHAAPWSLNRGPDGKARGMTIDQIKRYALDNGIDMSTMSIMDARIAAREGGRAELPEELADDTTGTLNRLRESVPTELFGARSQTFGRVVGRDYSHLARNRYFVTPSEVGEAIDGVANALDSPFMRGVEVVFHRIPSRLLLGLSPPWLMFQVAGNAIFTGLAGINPLDLVGGVRFARALEAADPEGHAAWEVANGITRGHHTIMDTPNLGATTSHFVAYMRAMKATRLGQLIHRKNPFDILFKADVAQTNFWRKAVWYSKARRGSYRRMSHNYKRSYQLIDRLTAGVLTKKPERLVQEYAKHGAEFESAAKHVRDFLGDYMNYTPSERLFFGRHFMFYGWLRHSLRFLFYTMPVGHPIMTSILANIGRLGAREQKDLLGVPENYDLPLSVSGAVYSGTTDNLRSLPLNRLNPFLNAVTQLDQNQQVLGMVSPMIQMAADQWFEESSFTGHDWRINGTYAGQESDRSRNYYGSTLGLLNPAAYAIPGLTEGKPRNRILERQVLNLAFPYRAWEKAKLEPSQSDDALAWSPRSLHPKEEEARKGIAKARREWRKEGPGAAVRKEVFPFPFLGAKRSEAPAFLKREMEKEADARNRAMGKKKPRRRRSPSRYGSSSSRYGGSSTNRYGGSSGSRYGG